MQREANENNLIMNIMGKDWMWAVTVVQGPRSAAKNRCSYSLEFLHLPDAHEKTNRDNKTPEKCPLGSSP